VGGSGPVVASRMLSTRRRGATRTRGGHQPRSMNRLGPGVMALRCGRARPFVRPLASLEGAAGPRLGNLGGRLELHIARFPRPRSGPVGGATCGFRMHLVTAPARCCPWSTRQLRTQHRPTRGVQVPSGRGRLRRSGPPRPGTDRPAGHGKADASVTQPTSCSQSSSHFAPC
jgi:hypothetical protein